MTDHALDPTPYEAKLRARLAELEKRLDGIEHDLDEPAPTDWEDRASERGGDEVLESLGDAGAAEIAQIKSALQRVADGEFGWCVNCGKAIARERLDLVPHAARCRFCAV